MVIQSISQYIKKFSKYKFIYDFQVKYLNRLFRIVFELTVIEKMHSKF